MISLKNQSTSEKILGLINPVPVSYDPEDDIHEETVAKVVDKYDDEFQDHEDSTKKSKLRKPVSFLQDEDERYTGKRVSRKTLHSDSDFEEQSSVQSESSEEQDAVDSDISELENRKRVKGSLKLGSDGQEEEVMQEEMEDESEDDDTSVSELEDEYGNDSDGDLDDDDDGEFQHISSKNEDEVEKGNCVRNQLHLWDNLLECRIQLQKCLFTANKLPHYEVFDKFIDEGGADFEANLENCKNNTKTLLDKLSTLRETLLTSYPETKSLGKSKVNALEASHNNGMDEEIPSGSEMEEDEVVNVKEDRRGKKRKLEDYEHLLDLQHKEFIDYRNANIQKWNDKTRVAGGNISSRNFSTFEQSTLKQIEQILSNRQRLIQRTRLKRSVYEILGHPTGKSQESVETGINSESLKLDDISKEFNPEIFDDTDFYHQLLRELIERKSSDVTDPVQLGRQWIEIQKLRSKMKRKVDLKATKGRKLRYVVHPKLVNFMAPISNSTWTEEAKSELFGSLFGNLNKNNTQ